MPSGTPNRPFPPTPSDSRRSSPRQNSFSFHLTAGRALAHAEIACPQLSRRSSAPQFCGLPQLGIGFAITLLLLQVPERAHQPHLPKRQQRRQALDRIHDWRESPVHPEQQCRRPIPPGDRCLIQHGAGEGSLPTSQCAKALPGTRVLSLFLRPPDPRRARTAASCSLETGPLLPPPSRSCQSSTR